MSTGSGRRPKTKQAGKRLRPREIRLRRTGSPTRRRIYTTFRTWPRAGRDVIPRVDDGHAVGRAHADDEVAGTAGLHAQRPGDGFGKGRRPDVQHAVLGPVARAADGFGEAFQPLQARPDGLGMGCYKGADPVVAGDEG